MKTIYKPYDERTPDYQYKALLRELLKDGEKKVPIHAKLKENKDSGHQFSKELGGRMLSFKLSNGFPLLTCRDLSQSFYGAIGEVVGFINGATTLEELKSFGCPEVFWDRWVTEKKCRELGLEPGSLGRGSYGKSLTSFQTEEGIEFNQVDALINNMKKMPFLRTHVWTTWNPPYSMGDTEQWRPREVSVAPCHGNFIRFGANPDTKTLKMAVTCRSSDVPVGLPLNIAEWSAVGLMVAYMLDYVLTEVTFFLCDPHYYDIQEESVKKLLNVKSAAFPTVIIDPNCGVNRIQDFRREHFILEDYHPDKKLRIPTAI